MATNTAKAVPYDRPSDINPLLREGGGAQTNGAGAGTQLAEMIPLGARHPAPVMGYRWTDV